MMTESIHPTDGRRYTARGARLYELVEQISGYFVARSGHDVAHAQSESCLIRIGRFSRHARGRGEDMGIMVMALSPETTDREREVIASEILWAEETFDPAAKNRMGTLGAFVSLHPSPERVRAAAERMGAEIRTWEYERTMVVVEARELTEGSIHGAYLGDDAGGPGISVSEYGASGLADTKLGDTVLLVRTGQHEWDGPRVWLGRVTERDASPGSYDDYRGSRHLVLRGVERTSGEFTSVRAARLALARLRTRSS